MQKTKKQIAEPWDLARFVVYPFALETDPDVHSLKTQEVAKTTLWNALEYLRANTNPPELASVKGYHYLLRLLYIYEPASRGDYVTACMSLYDYLSGIWLKGKADDGIVKLLEEIQEQNFPAAAQ